MHQFIKIFMGNRKRLRKHKQYAMNRRAVSGKKPMSAETKADRKKASAIDRARTKADLDKKSAK
jgi:hypothetical protein